MSSVWLNGEFMPLAEAKISVLDRGFLFADSIYEVIPFYYQQGFGLDAHWQRLENSMAAIDMPMPLSIAQWNCILRELVQRNPGQHQAVYLQITRGVGVVRNHVYEPGSLKPTCWAMSSEIQLPLYDQGFAGVLADDIRWQRADIKSTSLLPNVLQKQRAHLQGAVEVILHRDHQVTEGSASNVFMVKNQQVLTPPASPAILKGVARDIVIDLLAKLDIECRQESISVEQLLDADEVWMTSSTKGLLPIIELNQQKVGTGELGTIWQQASAAYLQAIEKLAG
jgi:D-alanine transaminase